MHQEQYTASRQPLWDAGKTAAGFVVLALIILIFTGWHNFPLFLLFMGVLITLGAPAAGMVRTRWGVLVATLYGLWSIPLVIMTLQLLFSSNAERALGEMPAWLMKTIQIQMSFGILTFFPLMIIIGMGWYKYYQAHRRRPDQPGC